MATALVAGQAACERRGGGRSRSIRREACENAAQRTPSDSDDGKKTPSKPGESIPTVRLQPIPNLLLDLRHRSAGNPDFAGVPHIERLVCPVDAADVRKGRPGLFEIPGVAALPLKQIHLTYILVGILMDVYVIRMLGETIQSPWLSEVLFVVRLT